MQLAAGKPRVGRHRLQTGLLALALERSAVHVVGESSCNGQLAGSAERLQPDAAVVDLDGHMAGTLGVDVNVRNWTRMQCNAGRTDPRVCTDEH